MNKYLDVAYGDYKNTDYPIYLVYHLLRKYYNYFTLDIYSLLDVGCGKKEYTEAFKYFCLDAWGIDRDVDFDFEKDKFKMPDNKFDGIFCKSVIEHIKNTDFFLSEILRVMKDGAKAVILTPAWEYNYKWFYDDPTHIKPFCRKGLQDAMRLAGFRNVSVKYFYHLPFTWHYDIMKIIPKMIRLLPDNWRWKNKEETVHNILIRFSKEVQLLAVGVK